MTRVDWWLRVLLDSVGTSSNENCVKYIIGNMFNNRKTFELRKLVLSSKILDWRFYRSKLDTKVFSWWIIFLVRIPVVRYIHLLQEDLPLVLSPFQLRCLASLCASWLLPRAGRPTSAMSSGANWLMRRECIDAKTMTKYP